MGQGGNLVLVNGTPYDWTTTYQHSYQMNSWPFPATVPAGQAVSLYVEWDDGIFTTTGDDAAEATMTLSGTDLSFQLQARGTPEPHLQTALVSIATPNNAQGSVIPLGWVHNAPYGNGAVQFILSGKAGNFSSSNPPVAWMQAHLATLGSRTLRALCMPGSHDAGMSTVTGGGIFGADIGTGDVLTQTSDVGGQLQLGSRFFDIRPVFTGGTFATGHYTGETGANGQTIDSIVADVNAFTAQNAELVILYLSHDMNTSADPWAAFSQQTWEQLLGQLTGPNGLDHLFIAPAPAGDLTTLTLNDFIGRGEAAVVVVVELPPQSGIDLSSRAGKGIYTATPNFPNYNQYANTDEPPTMENDQLAKLAAQRTSPNGEFFVLSWTLTQTKPDAVRGALGLGSVIGAAIGVNFDLYTKLLPACTPSTFPNVLFIDDITSSDIVALAMAVNHKTISG